MSFNVLGAKNEGNGLYYYRARYYSPLLNRFVSEEWIPRNLYPNDGRWVRVTNIHAFPRGKP